MEPVTPRTLAPTRTAAELVAAGASGSVLDDRTYDWPLVRGTASPEGPFPEYDDAPAGGRRRRP